MNTGHGAVRTMVSATLPSRIWRRPVRPWVPMTIRSTPSSPATCRISSAGLPTAIGPSPVQAAAACVPSYPQSSPSTPNQHSMSHRISRIASSCDECIGESLSQRPWPRSSSVGREEVPLSRHLDALWFHLIGGTCANWGCPSLLGGASVGLGAGACGGKRIAQRHHAWSDALRPRTWLLAASAAPLSITASEISRHKSARSTGESPLPYACIFPLVKEKFHLRAKGRRRTLHARR